MSALQVLKLGLKMYNKAGYRLESVVSLPVPKYAEGMGAQAIKKATIEHINGEKKIVETWLGKDGKAIRTIHKSSARPNERVVTIYQWKAPRIYKEDDLYHNYLKKDNPYVFENRTGKIKRSVLVSQEGKLLPECQKVTYTNLDINGTFKTVTKSMCTLEDKFNKSEIYSIQNGKKVKGLKTESTKQQDGTYKTINTDYFGVSKEDANFVFLDEYFYSRFLPNTIMARCSVAHAAKNQGVSYVPKLFKSQYPEHAMAYYDLKGIGLSKNITDNETLNAEVIDVLNHESKHLKQHELMERYLKEELTDPKEIELAKKYKQNRDNYITPFQDEKKYHEQLIEKEAYTAGLKARRLYFDVTDKLRRLFDFSSWHSVGA